MRRAFLSPDNRTYHMIFYLYNRQQVAEDIRRILYMKGFAVESGYMGLVEGRYVLFADEGDYREYMEG